MSKNEIRTIAVIFLIVAVVSRLVPHMYNMSAVAALGMFVGCFWSARIGALLTIAAMGISDLLGQVLGIHSMGAYDPIWLMFVVYAAMGASAAIGKLLQQGKDLPPWVKLPAGAVLASAVFFLSTNFACWLDPRMGYAPTISGLSQCYIAAIPFAKNELMGNLFWSAVFFGGYYWAAAPRQAKSDIQA